MPKRHSIAKKAAEFADHVKVDVKLGNRSCSHAVARRLAPF